MDELGALWNVSCLCAHVLSVSRKRIALKLLRACLVRSPNDAAVALHWPQYNSTFDTNLNISLPLSVSSGLKYAYCNFWDVVMHNLTGAVL